MEIWKIKFLASNLNLCLLNQLAQVEVKAFCLNIKQDSLGVWSLWNLQKQPFPGVFQNHSIQWKTPVLESLFNKVACLKAYNFIKKRLWHRCFPVNIAKLFRTAFFIEHLWWLLLDFLQSLLKTTVKKIVSR